MQYLQFYLAYGDSFQTLTMLSMHTLQCIFALHGGRELVGIQHVHDRLMGWHGRGCLAYHHYQHACMFYTHSHQCIVQR